MKTFLDVGAHMGQTLAAVMSSDFDRIVCFEPAPACWPVLRGMADSRVSVERFGLWNRTCDAPLFQPGTMGAGLWKKDRATVDETQVCKFVRASDWMACTVGAFEQVFLKLNCEGAECDILDDLLDSGQFDKIAFTMIDFDVRKIASMKHRQVEVMDRLSAYPFPRVSTSKRSMRGDTHAARIHNWLGLCQ